MRNFRKIKFYIGLISVLIPTLAPAQNIQYSISVPPSASEVAQDPPDSIDMNHYYSYKEIRAVAEPAQGWYAFYDNIGTLNYPDEAKKLKTQGLMTVAYMINEFGGVDSVYIHSVNEYGKWKACPSCESLILKFLKNTKWIPGKTGNRPVKSIDYIHILFSIYDPNHKQADSPFGY